MRLSENIAEVFLQEQGELTVAEVLERSEHRGFGFLLVILSLPIALPATPPGVSAPFAVLIGMLACQMMARRAQPWFPTWVMRRKVKTGSNKFLRAMRKWAAFFERFLRPRLAWVYSDAIFRTLLGPLLLVSAAVMFLPVPGFNTIAALAVMFIALGLLSDDGVFGLMGVLLAVLGAVAAVVLIVLLVRYGPEAIDMIRRWLGR